MSVIETQGFKLDNGGRRIVVDPVTRIEGHLRVEVNLDDKNVIRNAVSTGTMWRGLEVILKGRDPRDAWAFVERICGVCTGTHALVSVRAVEDALKIKIPDNANVIRNLMHAALYTHDHLVHFYHLHALDWVDVVSALKADPKRTSELAQSISAWPLSSPGYFRDLQSRLKKFVESGQLGPFRNGYWGHPAYKLPPEANLMAVAHYLEALDFQKEIAKIQTIFGGKSPHPNWLVGGVPCAINMEGTGAVGAINMERLNMARRIIDQAITFVDQVYVPDLLAIASFYKDWGAIGGGLSSMNLLAYGEFPDIANDDSNKSLLMPRGAIIGGDLKTIHAVDLNDPSHIQEFVNHSWYKYGDETKGLHPFDGVTEPNFELGKGTKGTKTNIESIDESAKYSWIKSPRFKGHAMEVGPLARYVIGYAMGKPEFKEPVDMVLKTLDVPITALFSTLGRTAARGLECSLTAHKMRDYLDKLIANLKAGNTATANIDSWEPRTWPATAQGAGYCEAPRGALGHWIKIKNTKIDNYQCVVPTTWNAGPRDTKNQIGAYEAALMNTPMAKPDEPLEILRTIHSFDPCLACSTHVVSPEGRKSAAPPCAEQIGARDEHPARQALSGLVWEAPVRILALADGPGHGVLVVTGYLIGSPLQSVGGEASDHYMFGYIRFAHFAAAYVFAIMFVLRLVWAFVGNRFAREIFLVPWQMLNAQWWDGLFDQTKYYLFMKRKARPWQGHNRWPPPACSSCTCWARCS